jgi:hypothetical protein
MPNHCLLVVSDLATHHLTAVREPCGGRRRLKVAGLLHKRGDDKLSGQMPTPANCEKARSLSIHDRCKARFEGFSFRA